MASHLQKSHHCPVEIQPNEQCTKSYTNPSSLYTHIVTSHNRKAYMIAKRKKSSNGFNGTCGIVRYEEWFGEVAQDEDANLENIVRLIPERWTKLTSR